MFSFFCFSSQYFIEMCQCFPTKEKHIQHCGSGVFSSLLQCYSLETGKINLATPSSTTVSRFFTLALTSCKLILAVLQTALCMISGTHPQGVTLAAI